MSVLLSASDVIDFAVQTEIRGERFYRDAAAATTDRAARELFARLADQEVRHKQIFEGLAGAEVLAPTDAETYQEALDYIGAAVEQEFFRPDAPIRKVSKETSTEEMVRKAIDFEKDTLLFFYGLRDLVQPVNQRLVDGIIGEEKKHIRELAAILRG